MPASRTVQITGTSESGGTVLASLSPSFTAPAASPAQVNLQIPFEAGAGPAVVAINHDGQVAYYPITIDIAAPGSVRRLRSAAPGCGKRAGARCAAGIGDGPGRRHSFARDRRRPAIRKFGLRVPAPRLPLTISVGEVPAETSFAGIPGGSAGLVQINWTVPDDAPPGVQPVIVTIGGVPSPPWLINVVP